MFKHVAWRDIPYGLSHKTPAEAVCRYVGRWPRNERTQFAERSHARLADAPLRTVFKYQPFRELWPVHWHMVATWREDETLTTMV